MNILAAKEEIGCSDRPQPVQGRPLRSRSGHQVTSPAFLADYKPDAVIVMNPLYADEIGRDLRTMGLAPEMLVDQPK